MREAEKDVTAHSDGSDALRALPTLDAHAHVLHTHGVPDLTACGAVLAMTLSIEEASHAVQRRDQAVAWGVGCHPGDAKAQESFNAHEFEDLVRKTAIVGEIGLDRKSPVPFGAQVKTFRSILEIVRDNPRLVSIHSNHATADVIDELDRQRISVPVLHWWSGSRTRTRAAVQMGCCFSIHARIAHYSLFAALVPLDRVLIETDHNYDDSPGDIPGLIESTEQVVAGKYQVEGSRVRRAAWSTLKAITKAIGGAPPLPEKMRELMESDHGIPGGQPPITQE